MSEPETLTVEVNGFSCRVWKKGEGPKLGFLAGFGGLPRWIPFLDALALRPTAVAIPLVTAGRAVAVLVIGFSEARALGPDEREIGRAHV